MKQLHVFYDAQCSFCLRCRAWLADEPAFVPLEFIPLQSPELVARFKGIEAFLGPSQLVVLSDEGAVYQGPNAFIICLYALRDYREWSLRLSTPALRPLAMRFFDLVSHRRRSISKWLDRLDDEKLLDELLLQAQQECSHATGDCAAAK